MHFGWMWAFKKGGLSYFLIRNRTDNLQSRCLFLQQPPTLEWRIWQRQSTSECGLAVHLRAQGPAQQLLVPVWTNLVPRGPFCHALKIAIPALTKSIAASGNQWTNRANSEKKPEALSKNSFSGKLNIRRAHYGIVNLAFARSAFWSPPCCLIAYSV